jgi:hypothetical protein
MEIFLAKNFAKKRDAFAAEQRAACRDGVREFGRAKKPCSARSSI